MSLTITIALPLMLSIAAISGLGAATIAPHGKAETLLSTSAKDTTGASARLTAIITPAETSYSLSGNWMLTSPRGQFRMALVQQGNKLTLTEYDLSGQQIGTGDGRVRGDDVYLRWIEPTKFNTYITLEANLTYWPKEHRLKGELTSLGNSSEVSLYRD